MKGLVYIIISRWGRVLSFTAVSMQREQKMNLTFEFLNNRNEIEVELIERCSTKDHKRFLVLLFPW